MDPHFSKEIIVKETTEPSAPDAGYVYVYAKSDGLLYSKDDAGVETAMGGGGGGGNFTSQAFTAQTSVTVTHNFGDYPVVEIIDNTGAVVVPLSVIHASVNAFTVTFSASTTGTIMASGGSAEPPGSGATFLTIVTDATTAITLDGTNSYPNYIRCTSASAITLTLAAGQSAAVGRHWIIRQAAAGVATVSANDSTPAAITRNGNASTGGQHTDITVRLVADGVLDIKDGTRLGISPTDIAGCAVWLDFADSSTLFDATVGGSTPAADGNIRRIEDKSGNSRHFTEHTSVTAPVRKLAQINGLDVGYFTSDYMSRAESLATSGGGALFMVVQRTALTGGIHGIRGNSDGNAHPLSSTYYESFGVTARQTWTQAGRTDVHLYSVLWSGAGTWVARINGTTVKTSTGLTGANTQNPIVLAANKSSSPNPGDGYYGELAVYTSAVSDVDRDGLEAALMAKWGI
jgi:hypothetical protein